MATDEEVVRGVLDLLGEAEARLEARKGSFATLAADWAAAFACLEISCARRKTALLFDLADKGVVRKEATDNADEN